MRKLLETIKTVARFFIFNTPYVILWREKVKEGGYIKLTNTFWIITSDGESQDALPLSFCSQELVDRIAADLNKRWWVAAQPTQQGERK